MYEMHGGVVCLVVTDTKYVLYILGRNHRFVEKSLKKTHTHISTTHPTVQFLRKLKMDETAEEK